MQKKFKVIGLDCANCARELEEELSKVKGVKKVSIAFITQKLVLEADDNEFDEVLNKCKKIASKFEDGVTIND